MLDLKSLGISSITPISKPIKQDLERAGKFIDFFGALKSIYIPIWFFDRTRFEARGNPCKVLAPKGSKPSFLYTGEHLRQNIMGAVNL